jgi:hypothetical protein
MNDKNMDSHVRRWERWSRYMLKKFNYIESESYVQYKNLLLGYRIYDN